VLAVGYPPLVLLVLGVLCRLGQRLGCDQRLLLPLLADGGRRARTLVALALLLTLLVLPAEVRVAAKPPLPLTLTPRPAPPAPPAWVAGVVVVAAGAAAGPNPIMSTNSLPVSIAIVLL